MKRLAIVALVLMVLSVATTALAENGSRLPDVRPYGNGTMWPLQNGSIMPMENGSRLPGVQPMENGSRLPEGW